MRACVIPVIAVSDDVSRLGYVLKRAGERQVTPVFRLRHDLRISPGAAPVRLLSKLLSGMRNKRPPDGREEMPGIRPSAANHIAGTACQASARKSAGLGRFRGQRTDGHNDQWNLEERIDRVNDVMPELLFWHEGKER
jgi:hypothetical protein